MYCYKCCSSVAVELFSDDGGLCSTQCILVLLSVTLHVSISFTLRVSTLLLCVEMCFTVCVCVCVCVCVSYFKMAYLFRFYVRRCVVSYACVCMCLENWICIHTVHACVCELMCAHCMSIHTAIWPSCCNPSAPRGYHLRERRGGMIERHKRRF